jgi:uncharacterized membrane protein YfcA
MITLIAKWIVVLFGVFIICVGLVMLLTPTKARETLKKAGSTNFINYAEITIRMIPAIGLILYSDFSRYPEAFKILGWFMLGSSLILYFVPRKLHHDYSLKCAEILTPLYFRLISPFSFLFGATIIYCVL